MREGGREKEGWPRRTATWLNEYDAKLGTYSFTETPDLPGHLFTTWAASRSSSGRRRIKRIKRIKRMKEVHLPIRPEI